MSRQELHPFTAIINKTQKNLAKEARRLAFKWLVQTFPKAFDTALSIQPLKIGIIKDILLQGDKAEQAGISRSKIRQAVAQFTREVQYLACLKAGGMRVDLEGNFVAAVTTEEAEQAALKIKQLVEKSVRNAKLRVASALPAKSFSIKTQSKQVKQTSSYTYPSHGTTDYHEERSLHSPTKTAPVITRKNSRVYDPAVVARLKEKLGLGNKEIKHSEEEVS